MPSRTIKWGTAFAHWGDTFAALSQAKYILDHQGGEKCSIIHCGNDPNIAEFCEAQPWIDRAINLYPADYHSIYKTACEQNGRPETYIPRLAKAAAEAGITGFPRIEDVTSTHHIYVYGTNYRARPLQKAELPLSSMFWAEEWWDSQDFQGRAFLLHPSSTWSHSWEGHWPHWRQAVDWLLDYTSDTYILTGQNDVIERKHPRLINLIGATSSNSDVLALAEMAEGVISTCNNLSLWTVIQGLPGLICGNSAIKNHINYFRRFIDRPPNYFIPVEASFEDWVAVAKKWLPNPEKWASRELKKWQERLKNLTPAVVESQPKPDCPQYLVEKGMVSGKKQDYSRGAIVEAKDLNGPVDRYLEMGVITLLEA